MINETARPLTLTTLISTKELDQALQWMSSGESCGVDYLSTRRTLTKSTEYGRLLRDAAVCDFHEGSVEVGVIAGLRLASLLFNRQLEFLQEIK